MIDLKKNEMNETKFEELINNKFVNNLNYEEIFRNGKFSEQFIKKYEKYLRDIDCRRYYGHVIFDVIIKTQDLSKEYLRYLYDKGWNSWGGIYDSKNLDIQLFEYIKEKQKAQGYMNQNYWILSVVMSEKNKKEVRDYVKKNYKQELWEAVLSSEWLYEMDDGNRFLHELYMLRQISGIN